MAWIRERRRKDGGITYVVTWREPGERTESTLSIKDDKARAELNVRLLDANGQSFQAAKSMLAKTSTAGPTVQENLRRHVELLTSAGPDQLKRYGRAIDRYFGGRIGKIPVASADHEDVVLWVKFMQSATYKGKPLSAKTIANHHGLLSASMETAVRLRLRADNPCKGIKLPKDQSTAEKMRVMTAAESLSVVMAHRERYRVFVACLRATGARFGEVTALFPDDFDLDAPTPTVRIERAWKRDANDRFYLGPPKTRKSRRSVSLPPSFVKDVRALIESTPPGAHVFRTSYDGPIRHSTFWQFWDEALDSLHYPKAERPRIHDMRHTHASLMLAGGMNIYELSRRLGHESIQTTIDRYSHLIPDAHFRAAEIAQQALES
ncbi:tyrosine-type recombinase/integrase [Arthrobacter sp. RCC_34]|uniref:tyrosine-type recombinase/integrase n=1 Tax=Arthrobacter sp. RCC_34 TaxID=3239230 RepID=UPI00352683E5